MTETDGHNGGGAGPVAVHGGLPRGIALGVLLAILAAGGVLRFAGLNWDPGNSFHCDERNVIGPAISLRAEDGYRPRFFAYGSLPIYIVRLAAEGAVRVGLVESARDWQLLKVLARGLSALCSTLSVLLIYLIAARLFDRRVALLAAALTAFSVLLIQNAHFGTVESMLGLCLLGCVWAAARVMQDGRWRDYLWFSFFAGMGLGTKASAVSFFSLLLAGAVIHMVWRRRYQVNAALLPAGLFLVLTTAVLLLWPEGAPEAVSQHVNPGGPYTPPERLVNKLLQAGPSGLALWGRCSSTSWFTSRRCAWGGHGPRRRSVSARWFLARRSP